VIKAIFFDWFNTLARYDPPREELQSQALREFGIKAAVEKVRQGLAAGDKYLFDENFSSPLRKRSREEQAKLYLRHQEIILTEIGVAVTEQPDLSGKILMRLRELSRDSHFVLFDDVLPTLKALRKQKLTLGLLTNLDRDMTPLCRELGLEPYLDFVVTSGEVDSDKPHAPIFLTALERAGVKAAEAIHIGDQYKVDVVGARGVGIAPLLLDRYDLSPEVNDCPRLHSLSEVPKYLT
jgi:HAD superfamily hydrolase (TIGR01549 family)